MKRVIIIENDEDTRQTLSSIIKEFFECEVETVGYPQKLGEMLDNKHYDLVIADHFTLTQDNYLEILKEKCTKGCKVLIMSTLKDHEGIQETFNGLKYDSIIKKPFDLVEFQKAVSNYGNY